MGVDFEYPEYMYDKLDYDLFHDLVERKRHEFTSKKIVIFGAGIRGSIFGVFFNKEGIDEYEYCDNNSQKWGGTIGKHRIISPEELGRRVNDSVVLISLESKDIVDEIEKQLCGMGFQEGESLFSLPSEVYDRYLEEFNKPIENHILVLGDCRFTFVSITDNNLTTLNDMMKGRLDAEKYPAKVLSMHALCMRAQYFVLKAQIEMGNIPKVMLLPINIETYNGTTHLLSSSQHSELMRRIYEGRKTEDDEFKEYVQLTKDRILNPPFIFSIDQESGSPTVTDKKLRIFLKMSYMYSPDETGEGVVFLKKAFELAGKYNIKILAFVPPLNYMSGKEFWGEKFLTDYQNIVNYFERIVQQYGGRFLDQSYLLSEDEFYSKYDKNEIANFEGRTQMTESLIDFLKENVGEN